jgi:hypothetical protein
MLIVTRPEPFKFINFPADTKVKANVDGESVTLSTNRLVIEGCLPVKRI